MSGKMLFVLSLLGLASAMVAGQTRPTPPTRDPHTAGYVAAKELPDGTVPSPAADGNFIIGPTHDPAADTLPQPGVPQGTVFEFTMNSTDSKIYPGIAREPNTFGTVDPANPAKLNVTASHPAPYTRHVAVYVPKQYVPGTEAPFLIGADGPDRLLPMVLDNLIAQHRVPVMIAISIGNGSGDAQGSERGLEYDTMSGTYAEFVEKEVLPLVEAKYKVKLTHNPDGRATMGGSSGGSCALIMAWYRPDLYHRVLTYSGTYVNQQWPWNPSTPQGAWGFHQELIPHSPVKPLRIWMEVGDRDLFNPNSMRDDMHDWVVANENMATYSGTYVNQQWPWNPSTPQGAWGFHQELIPHSPVKPLRIWMEVGDRDLFNPNSMRDDMHDWVVANENMARVLAAKGYHYQFVFARNAGHTDRAVKSQTLPEALEYLWQGYPITH